MRAEPVVIGTKVKFCSHMVGRGPMIRIGAVGVITEVSKRAFLVRFPEDSRWCWRDEIDPV